MSPADEFSPPTQTHRLYITCPHKPATHGFIMHHTGRGMEGKGGNGRGEERRMEGGGERGGEGRRGEERGDGRGERRG